MEIVHFHGGFEGCASCVYMFAQHDGVRMACKNVQYANLCFSFPTGKSILGGFMQLQFRLR